ncbi:LapA family protein [Parvularcula marina]|uniref:LapA family protein n=1 Tax=Parvularcula marina TaxID=2292771 RepID=A0A371RJ35_9PROT|nr:LapA family protein [Parvularcula marina]RFB05456.1 LapA family protein [Parvularcula marina]
MRKLLAYFLFFVFGLLLVVFFVANRQMVRISLDPTSLENPALATPAIPLWAALIACLIVGFLLGAFGMWLSAGSLRRKAKDRKREIRRLEDELTLAVGDTPKKSRLLALRR